jgi:hypothetical protein
MPLDYADGFFYDYKNTNTMEPNQLIYFKTNVPVSRCVDHSGKPRKCHYSTLIRESFIKLELGEYCLQHDWSYEAAIITRVWIECSQDVRDKVGWRDWHGLTVLEYQHLLIPSVVRNIEELKEQKEEADDIRYAKFLYGQQLERKERKERDGGRA